MKKFLPILILILTLFPSLNRSLFAIDFVSDLNFYWEMYDNNFDLPSGVVLAQLDYIPATSQPNGLTSVTGLNYLTSLPAGTSLARPSSQTNFGFNPSGARVPRYIFYDSVNDSYIVLNTNNMTQEQLGMISGFEGYATPDQRRAAANAVIGYIPPANPAADVLVASSFSGSFLIQLVLYLGVALVIGLSVFFLTPFIKRILSRFSR